MLSKAELYRIVFNSDTKQGRQFDIILLWCILFSVFIAIVDSVPNLPPTLHTILYILEWLITIVFTIEYLLRVYISHNTVRYVFSFWGAVDLLSILPTYLSLFVWGTNYLLVVRILRLLRVFRILKLANFNAEAIVLVKALKASMHKISIFLFALMTINILLGTVMYVIEGGRNGFTSIPQSIYWAIITVTTVGYGDIVPRTNLGKFISSIAMIVGYAIIAIPTGIVSVEMSKAAGTAQKKCPECSVGNDIHANFCSHCGTALQ